MKNKHLILLALFGGFGIIFFQNWPFTVKKEVNLPFLSLEKSSLESIEFLDANETLQYELRRTPKWVLSTKGFNHALSDSAVQKYLFSFDVLDKGVWSALPANSVCLGQWKFTCIRQKPIRRAVFKSPDAQYYVRIFNEKTDAYLLYNAASIFDKITSQNIHDLRNRTIIPINPTEIKRFSFSTDAMPPVFYEKKDSVWLGLGTKIGKVSATEMTYYLNKLEKLNLLPFADSFEEMNLSSDRKLSFNFETLADGLQLQAVQTKQKKWFVQSSALENQWFELPDSSQQFLFFNFGF